MGEAINSGPCRAWSGTCGQQRLSARLVSIFGFIAITPEGIP